MASLRTGVRKDDTAYFQVLFRHRNKQTSLSFNDYRSAREFKALVDRLGPARGLEAIGAAGIGGSGETVADWTQHYIDTRTGLAKSTLTDYRAYLRNDIAPAALGAVPLTGLTRDDVGRWVQKLSVDGTSAKTVANKANFLSAALNAAVKAGRIPANPAIGVRLPRGERREMTVLTKDELSRLIEALDEHYRPLVKFLAASGARWGEVTALRPGDVDRAAGTVRISRSWRRTYARGGGYELGPPKTKTSVRTINIPSELLDGLSYDGDWLFTNPRTRGPVRSSSFHSRIWSPAVAAAGLNPKPRIYDLRHTCASWLIAAGVPLPVVQRHLGHQDIGTTIRVYTHIDRSSMVTAAKVISGLINSTC